MVNNKEKWKWNGLYIANTAYDLVDHLRIFSA